MLDLLPLMVERAGILIVLAFLLSRMKLFRQMIIISAIKKWIEIWKTPSLRVDHFISA